MSNYIVGIGEKQIACSPIKLQALGLGSCIGLSLYDPVTRIGGLAHIMLPNSNSNKTDLRGKYADTATNDLLAEMLKQNARKETIVAKIVGGASMFGLQNDVLRIGEKNIHATKSALKELGIPIVSEDVGGTVGRTVILHTENGNVEVKSVTLQARKII